MSANIILTGKIAGDVSMQYTQSGKALTRFSLRTTRRYTSNNQKVTESTFWNCTIWFESLAEAVAEHLQKGDSVEVNARMAGTTVDTEYGVTLYPRVWEGKNGQARSSFDVVVESIDFVHVQAWQDEDGPSPKNNESSAPADDFVDDIPF